MTRSSRDWLFVREQEPYESAAEAYVNYHAAGLEQVLDERQRSREPSGHTQFSAPYEKARQ